MHHHQEYESPSALSDTIKCFWYDRRDVGETLSSYNAMPDGYAEIIFYFGSLYNISPDESLQPLASPFMMGLLNQPVPFSTINCLEIIGVRCFPWTVFDLLGLPSSKKAVHFFEHPVAQLQSTLNEFVRNGKIEEAISHLQQYFLDAHSHVDGKSMLAKAGVAMRKANGTMPVSEVAAAAHATVRTLERNFKQSSGHTVKDVSGLMRFEQVRNQLWRDPYSNIAGLAAEFGYADQAHLSKEFKRYSGATPAAFARKAKQSKLSVSKDFVAFIQD
ncbi:AraC family transcriptional regulator [Pinibacter soli]|uniref:Helix-turn-helix domain-containing protein n=1 Tax=Pinibacter soli TaxID=3044211 RepID=A0ABT6RCB9_9BACT|nr:helix-turn-helix domain-containing protein [Pinibacter soli]MDI3320217.1 helix-turn-helix domain-containing protein [Pinibacter soli]